MFTAGQARALPAANRFARDLESNERRLESLAGHTDARQVAHYRAVGVLLSDGGDIVRMQREMTRRDFRAEIRHVAGVDCLRVYW